MSLNLEIDMKKCSKCGVCVRACSLNFIDMIDGAPQEYPDMCNRCGHCVATCPEDAITIKNMDMKNYKPMQAHGILYEQYYNLVRNRRSLRYFKQEPISEEHISQLMESVRYIPTGANRQQLKYIAVSDLERIHDVSETIAKRHRFLKRLARPLKRFLPKQEYLGFMRGIDLWKEYKKAGFKGTDPYLRNAPCVILIYAKKQNILNEWEAGLASYNLILAAETLGIGTQLAGYIQLTAKVFKSINRACGVPKKHKILAAMILGYPDIKYKKTVDRNHLDVKRY